VFGVSASGVASEVGLSPSARNGQNVSTSPPIAALRLPGGTVVPIRAASGFGVIEWIGAPRYQLVVSPPPGGTWADYSWLEIDAGAGFREDAWSVTDGGGDSGHDIMFSTSNSSPSRYRVHVGSCAQWHGYTPKSLFLGHGNVQDIASVRLLP
jgi:hypothetical protein